MGALKKQKNVVEDTTIKTQGDVTIGDRTKQTFNIYGMEASQNEIKFFAKCFVFLLALFGILAVIFVYWPNPEERLAVFFCGAFFALCLYFLIVLLRTLRPPSIKIK
jgi:hypothetical protein